MRVLFVSKPFARPFHDGTLCLVRDVATGLRRWDARLLGVRGAPVAGLGDRVEVVPAYADRGRFAPAVSANARIAAWLALHGAADLWHFVFAPNPRASHVGRALTRLRRVPSVQTVASPPRSFDRPATLLFGDAVVVQSEHTRRAFERAFEHAGVASRRRAPLWVVPPPLGPIAARAPEAQAAVRRALDLEPDAQVLVYPGDLETSRGAETFARLAESLAATRPALRCVFAYRAKTPEADRIAERLRRRLPPASVRVTRDLPDVLALVATSSAVVFPVDDLTGKVDLPIVLLEAMALGVPVVTVDHGPLAELEGTLRLPLGDGDALARTVLALLTDDAMRAPVVEAQRAAIRARHASGAVAARYEEVYDDVVDRRRR